MFIDTLNRLVHDEEGKLIAHTPPEIPQGTTIKIEWDEARITYRQKNFKKGSGYFNVSRTISTKYAFV